MNIRRETGWSGDDLDATAKWSPLFEEKHSPSLSAVKLGDIASCRRGIATGANDYFTLRESERRRWRIERRDVTPCITKAGHLRQGPATAMDVRRIIAGDERIYLFSPRRPLAPSARKYLAEGRRRGIPQRYLPAHRPIWYLPEKRRPAPILVSVFARGQFRFVLNRARVLNLTAYHGIYPRTNNPSLIRKVFAYLTSRRGHAELRRHCRIYADGLLKVEPRDVEAMAVPLDLAAHLGRAELPPGRKPRTP